MVRPQVHSTKHYVQIPFSEVTTGAVENVLLVSGVALLSKNLASEVEEGSSVKAIYIEMWLQNEGNLGSFIATVSKQTEFGTGPTVAEMASLMTYTNKKNVFWTSQGLTSNDGISGPVNILRTWIKIPKSKQRFGLGDILSLSISNVSTSDLNRCGFATYKEYT